MTSMEFLSNQGLPRSFENTFRHLFSPRVMKLPGNSDGLKEYVSELVDFVQRYSYVWDFYTAYLLTDSTFWSGFRWKELADIVSEDDLMDLLRSFDTCNPLNGRVEWPTDLLLLLEESRRLSLDRVPKPTLRPSFHEKT